jgi:hypothetical protein
MDENIQDESMSALLNRQQELKRKLIQAHRIGMSQTVLNQLQYLISEVEFAIADKLAAEDSRQRDKNNGNDFDDLIIG